MTCCRATAAGRRGCRSCGAQGSHSYNKGIGQNHPMLRITTRIRPITSTLQSVCGNLPWDNWALHIICYRLHTSAPNSIVENAAEILARDAEDVTDCAEEIGLLVTAQKFTFTPFPLKTLQQNLHPTVPLNGYALPLDKNKNSGNNFRSSFLRTLACWKQHRKDKT